MTIHPSILSADWSNMREALAMCKEAGVEGIHIDVMDGNFVPPISFGNKFIADMKRHSDLFFDTHLMVNNPQAHIDTMIQAGSNALTFHIEATHFSYRIISYIKKSYPDVQIGIALNPQTSLTTILPMISELDIVVLMGVEPGFGGQSFITQTLQKITALVSIRKQQALQFRISIDGGVNITTAQDIIKSGADILVMGSAFFKEENKKNLISTIYNIR